MYLVHAAQYIEETVQPDEQCPVIHNLRIPAEKRNHMRCNDEFRNADDKCAGDGKGQRGAYAGSDSFNPAGTGILTDEGGCGKGKALHRQDDEGVNPSVGTPSGSAGCAEVIDVRLHEYVGE